MVLDWIGLDWIVIWFTGFRVRGPRTWVRVRVECPVPCYEQL